MLTQGLVSGTPVNGTDLVSPFTFTLEVQDALNNTSTRVLSITVADCGCSNGGVCH